MVKGGFKRARVHNNFKSEHLTLEQKVAHKTMMIIYRLLFFSFDFKDITLTCSIMPCHVIL